MSPKANPFEEELRFLRGVLASPRRVGAIAPSSRVLADAVGRQLDPSLPGPVLELGPGTGALTRGILARGFSRDRLTAVEVDKGFAETIAAEFAPVRVIHGDAFDLDRTLAGHAVEPFIAVVSGLPLLNFNPHRRRALLDQAFRVSAPGAPFILYSYGLHSPIAPSEDITVTMAAFVWRNLPPARVWVYRKR